MPNYQSIQDHDLLQDRANRLIEFVCFLIIAAFALAFCWGLLEGAADTQAIRQTALDKEIQAQLDKCHSGNFCKVMGKDEQFRFLTLSRRER